VISSFVASYGYFAVFVGTLLEGETILAAGGFAAHGGLLDWRLVLLVASIGATLGDQVTFLLGRWKGAALIGRFPFLAARKQRVHDLLERYDILFILSVRFLYGLRIAGPFILGSSRIPLLRFAGLNVAGAALWAALITGIGYAFGAAVTSLLGDLQRVEGLVMAVILALGAGFWFWRKYLGRTRNAAGIET
jgi:membrane protein DedA with SNARE-associated domain